MVKIVEDFSFEKYSPLDIKKLLDTGDEVILRLDNTSSLSLNKIELLKKLNKSNRLKIRVEGGYKGKEVYSKENNVENYFTFKADTYRLDELKEIYSELLRIETGINPNWDDLQKVLYFVGELKNNIIYNPFVVIDVNKTNPEKDQSLRSLISGYGVCASYALILKELCDRNNIECDLVFGATREKDKGRTTHAWNIVTVNGKKIPIDSTWNAYRYNGGYSLDFADSANINNFIKKHYPAKYEKIKDYKKELVSIDGFILRNMNSFINKDVKYCTNIFKSTRKDGSKFQVTQLEDFIVDNNHLYRYLYRKEYPDGTFGKPLVLYSSFNIAKIVRNLNENKSINSGKVFNNVFDNILFSKSNISRAIKDKSFYLGGIDKKIVVVDLKIGDKIKVSQRSFERKDGSKISIQVWPNFNVDGVNRYIVYEYILEKGKNRVSKNTVFTEMDLMKATEEELDLLLERSRIDRKSKETNGYLGRIYGKDKLSDPKLVKYFSTELPNKLKIKDNYFIDYFKEITFDDMKKLVKTYERKNENGKIKFFNRVTGSELKDEELCLKAAFSYIWLKSAGIKYYYNEVEDGYNYAFNEPSEEVFNNICKLINNSIVKDGNINPTSIFIEIEKSKYKYALDIVVNLFSTDSNISIINELFKKQNPSSVSKKKQNIKGFGQYIGDSSALFNANELADKEKRERELKQILKVFATSDGKIEIVKKI